MARLTIRQSGGANIISIPQAILRALNLQTGSSVKISINDHKIVLTPVVEEMTLENLLSGSPKLKLRKTKEDQDWLSAPPVAEEEL